MSRRRRSCSGTSTTWCSAAPARRRRWLRPRPTCSPCRHDSPANACASGYDGNGMPQDAAFYRIGLIETIILLLLFVLTFGAITIMARERGLALGPTRSLLARLAPPALVASVAAGGLSGVVLNLLPGRSFSDTPLSSAAPRHQPVLHVPR